MKRDPVVFHFTFVLDAIELHKKQSLNVNNRVSQNESSKKIYFHFSFERHRSNMAVSKLSIDNPFTQTENTDVVFKVENQSLYAHSKILCYQSAVFKKLLLEDESCSYKEIVLENKNIKDVIVFLKFLYPEHQMALTSKSFS